MEQDPDAIKRDIEQTQQRMGDTVEALAYKTDVPARTKEAVGDRVDAVKSKVADVVDSARSALGGTATSIQATAANAADAVGNAGSAARDAVDNARSQAPSGGQVKARFETLRSGVENNPLGLALGCVATGFLIGLALPISKIERDQVGPLGEQMVDKAKATAGSAIEHGKAVVTQVVGDVLNKQNNS